MHYKVKKERRHSGKLLMLLIGVILVIYFIRKVSSTNFIGNVLKAFDQSSMKFTQVVDFNDEQRDSAKQALSGFWSYTTDASADVYIDDRLEITKNGYIWQVEQIRFALPSGKVKKLVRAVHAYLHPCSRVVDSSLIVNCTIRTFNQIWIDGQDTCEIKKYIEYSFKGEGSTIAYYDRVADISNAGEKISLEGRAYSLYKGNDLKTFFPAGIIDELYNQTTCDNMQSADMYKITKGVVTLKTPLKTKCTVNIRMIKECKGDGTLRGVLRESIAHDLQTGIIAQNTKPAVLAVIKKFYVPYCIEPFIYFPAGHRKDGYVIVNFIFDITSQGATDNVRIAMKEKTIGNKVVEREIAQEVGLWKFQPLEKGRASFHIVFADTLNN